MYPTPISCEPRRSQPGTLLSCEAGPKQDEEDEPEAEDGEDEEEEEEEREKEPSAGRDVSRMVSGMLTHLDVAGNVRLLSAEHI